MPIPTDPPYIKITDFILSKDGDTLSISRRPSFSNTFSLNSNRIFMDENDILISYRDPQWPKYNVINVDFYPLTAAYIALLVAFIKNHLGEVIDMTINNSVYSGVITEPKIEIMDEHDDNCTYKCSIVFETEECL